MGLETEERLVTNLIVGGVWGKGSLDQRSYEKDVKCRHLKQLTHLMYSVPIGRRGWLRETTVVSCACACSDHLGRVSKYQNWFSVMTSQLLIAFVGNPNGVLCMYKQQSYICTSKFVD